MTIEHTIARMKPNSRGPWWQNTTAKDFEYQLAALSMPELEELRLEIKICTSDIQSQLTNSSEKWGAWRDSAIAARSLFDARAVLVKRERSKRILSEEGRTAIHNPPKGNLGTVKVSWAQRAAKSALHSLHDGDLVKCEEILETLIAGLDQGEPPSTEKEKPLTQKPTGTGQYIRCPLCDQTAQLRTDGAMDYHDNLPRWRSVCQASKRTPSEATAMRLLQEDPG